MSENPEAISTDILVEVLNGRREFYLALAGFYFKPLTQEQIDTMAQTDYSEFGVGEPLIEDGFNDITRFLRKRNTGTRQMLAIDFTSSFGGAATYKGETAMPYASLYLSETGLLSQQPRGEVFRVFKRNLLRVIDENTPDDHLSFMLEFLSIMSERAEKALLEGDAETARGALEESRGFITDQVLTWFDMFSKRAETLLEARFYRGVLKVTKGYLLMDLQTIDDLLEGMLQS
ncbi:MAG: molecular chaperone TorD family protein [Eggerthellaceae bacterium]|jgi:TorA maturation chaperone TorD|nr:molecular chaperone TorD family protein [Eggerthellaceae bacterium]